MEEINGQGNDLVLKLVTWHLTGIKAMQALCMHLHVFYSNILDLGAWQIQVNI